MNYRHHAGIVGMVFTKAAIYVKHNTCNSQGRLGTNKLKQETDCTMTPHRNILRNIYDNVKQQKETEHLTNKYCNKYLQNSYYCAQSYCWVKTFLHSIMGLHLISECQSSQLL